MAKITANEELREVLRRQLGDADVAPTETLGREALTIGARLAARPDVPLPSVTIGDDASNDFRILETLGEGGMGLVYRARQRALGRDVALKRLREDAGEANEIALLREATLAGRLEHPNLVPIHGLGHCEGVGPVVVMKRVRGEPMKVRLADLDRDDEPAIAAHVETLVHVCDAMDHAHRQGIVHRDLKPENVMLGDLGEVYVVDWGVALDLGEDRVDELLVGTPAYMAPEMVDHSGAIDERTDVYLLGGILHEILTGRPPHRGRDSTSAMLNALRPVQIQTDHLPEELVAICLRACALLPENRFPTAAALRDALHGWLEHRSAAQLATRAHAQLAEALVELEGDAPDHAATLERLDRVRHGFQNAVELWPGNPRALEGLDAVTEPILRCQLALGNLPAARRLVEQARTTIDPALRARLETLEAKREEEERARHHIQALARERDLAIGGESRRAISILIVGALSATAAAVFAARGGTEPGHPTFLFGLSVVLFAFVSAIVLAMRSRLLANYVNRFTILTVLACFGGVVLHRGLALLAGHTGLEIVQTDLVLVTVLISLLAIVHRGFLLVSAVGVVGAVVAHAWPESARYAINAVPVLLAAGIYVMWRRLSFSDQTLVERMGEPPSDAGG
ncbi:MAG: serine/threonine protein kinase [Myxococcales bacterium]|nr:serine/threonine protein kinase [Myxococcales bacterium]